MPAERFDQFGSRSVIHTFARLPFAVLILPDIIRDIADAIIRLKQQFQVGDEILHGVPCSGRGEAGKAAVTVIFDCVVPSHAAVLAEHRPAPVLRHLNNGAAFDWVSAATKALPQPVALTGMISAVVPGPVVPYGAGVTLLLKRHADRDPVGTGQFRYVYGLEG